nr:hypothetical protein [Tanacetum cinerariifolium]
MKLKSEALKERAKVSRPIKAFTVYPSNTPATLVPRVLPTTSQVKIHIFTRIQQFLEFDKTCKKRITPSAITDGERGFEQTKACYLQELTKVTDPVTNLQAHNDRFRAENDKVKQHYKQLYDSIKITRAKHIEQVTKLTAKNVTLKTSVSKAKVQPSVLTRTKHAVDVELIVPCLRNNRDAHLDYLRSIVSACRYTQHSQELLEYAIGTCPQSSQQRAKQLVHTPLIRK